MSSSLTTLHIHYMSFTLVNEKLFTWEKLDHLTKSFQLRKKLTLGVTDQKKTSILFSTFLKCIRPGNSVPKSSMSVCLTAMVFLSTSFQNLMTENWSTKNWHLFRLSIRPCLTGFSSSFDSLSPFSFAFSGLTSTMTSTATLVLLLTALLFQPTTKTMSSRTPSSNVAVLANLLCPNLLLQPRISFQFLAQLKNQTGRFLRTRPRLLLLAHKWVWSLLFSQFHWRKVHMFYLRLHVAWCLWPSKILVILLAARPCCQRPRMRRPTHSWTA